LGRNELLRAARGRVPSRAAPGECLSRAELAEAVNAWLWSTTGQRFELDGHHIAKYERGVVRFPIGPYRAALRAVLGVRTDAELGFAPSRRRIEPEFVGLTGGPWSLDGILDASDEATRTTLINRREALRSGLAATGAAILGPLAAGWLEPLAGFSTRAGSTFSVAEVEALERAVILLREWRSAGLGPSAVVAQLGDVTDRLHGAADNALTGRVFLAAAELSKTAGSMYFDVGAHASAQRYYVLAVQLAKAAREGSFAAATLAALARQSFDLGAAADGLEIIHLAQHGTRDTATPGLRAMLATRQAWGHAQQGEVYAFRRAVDSAEQSFADAAGSSAEPRWLSGLDAAELAGVIGARFRDLARHDPTQARHAVTYIGKALELRDPARTRNRAFDLVGLARAHLVTGDPERGCELVGEALPLIDLGHPGRAARKLGDWSREAADYGSVPVVRETQDRVRELVTAS
jgi:hypothetical protein